MNPRREVSRAHKLPVEVVLVPRYPHGERGRRVMFVADEYRGVKPSTSSVLLSSLELSDTQVYEP